MKISLLFVLLMILGVLLGGVMFAMVVLRPPARIPLPASVLQDLPPSAPPVPSVSTTPVPHVVCEGCEAPSPVVRVEQQATVPAASGTITKALRYTPDSYTVFGGARGYPHDLVREILEQQKLGHLSFRVDIPDASYAISGTEVRPGVYEVRPGDVVPAEDARMIVPFSIRFPVLTDAQYAFLRGRKDYRFVYGLIRGIVDHEMRHYRELAGYVSTVEGILRSPITQAFTVTAGSRAEFDARAGAEVSRVLAERLTAADTHHQAKQDALDNPENVADIHFVFEEEVNGSVPPPLTARFIGEGQFSFTLPAGAPRPPVPQIPK